MSLFKFHISFDEKFYDSLILSEANSIIRNGKKTDNMFAMIGLGETSKLGTLSFGIPTKYCKMGRLLADDPESPCHYCYATHGHFTSPTVHDCYESRYLAWKEQPHWIEAMTLAIKSQVKKFRWFDSGDVQSPYMIEQIMEIARRTPGVKHWLPTQEHEMFETFVKTDNEIPKNMIVRLSSRKIGINTASELAAELNDYPNVLGTVDSSYILPKDCWEKSPSQCVAPLQDEKCGSCKKCYVEGPVAYKLKYEGKWNKST